VAIPISNHTGFSNRRFGCDGYLCDRLHHSRFSGPVIGPVDEGVGESVVPDLSSRLPWPANSLMESSSRRWEG
jgi:hypothetical protein